MLAEADANKDGRTAFSEFRRVLHERPGRLFGREELVPEGLALERARRRLRELFQEKRYAQASALIVFNTDVIGVIQEDKMLGGETGGRLLVERGHAYCATSP